MLYASEYAAIVAHYEKLKAAIADGVPIYDVPDKGPMSAPSGLADVFNGRGLKPLSAAELTALVKKVPPTPEAFEAKEGARRAAVELAQLKAQAKAGAAEAKKTAARIASLEKLTGTKPASA